MFHIFCYYYFKTYIYFFFFQTFSVLSPFSLMLTFLLNYFFFHFQRITTRNLPYSFSKNEHIAKINNPEIKEFFLEAATKFDFKFCPVKKKIAKEIIGCFNRFYLFLKKEKKKSYNGNQRVSQKIKWN